MSFIKKSENMIFSSDNNEKNVIIYYIYKSDLEDELDEKELYKCAISKINENETFDVICHKCDIWFGVSDKCFTCIYIDFNDEDINLLNALQFIDNKKWKFNCGFYYLENVYNKIIITSTKDPNTLFQNSNKWKNKIKQFQIIKL